MTSMVGIPKIGRHAERGSDRMTTVVQPAPGRHFGGVALCLAVAILSR